MDKAMPAYCEIENVSTSPQFGNCGPNGWGFALASNLIDDEAPHRAVLERFAAAHPTFLLKLPQYEQHEDFVECYAMWNSKTIWIYFETVLSHLWLWSADRNAIETLRLSITPNAEEL